MAMFHYRNSFERSAGFIFIAVLIFLQLVSLTSLFGIMQTSVMMKKNIHQWDNIFYNRFSDTVLKKIEERQVAGISECLIPIMPAYVLLHQTHSWWETHTCSDNLDEIRYHYAVELLGTDDCSVIHHASNQPMAATFERITVYVKPKGMHAKYVIQSTIAVSSDVVSLCQSGPHEVNVGRQMWRMF